MNGYKLRLVTGKCFRLKLGYIVLVSLLAGCSNDNFSDLHKYIQSVKAKPKGAIEPLPEVKPIQPFIFKPDILRDPFKPINKAELPENSGIAIGNGPKPDFQRRKEELEAFPLDALKMVGTVVMNAKLWALIKATDNTVHRVQLGNYMGKNHGKIIRISMDRIELMEIVPDKPGTWREQQTSLALVD
ncbi:MAG: pilus assembly protein PilP [Methylovulum sp.]|nr:pilus assembly protein PilP [Methylovulum sp.]